MTSIGTSSSSLGSSSSRYKEKSDIKGKVIFKINKKLKNKFLEKHDRKS